MAVAELPDIWAEDAPARKRRWIWLLLLLLAAAASAGALAWRRRATAPAPSPSIRTWVAPQLRRLPQSITTSGTVRLRDGAQVRVGSQVSGIVAQLNVAVGSRIQAGEVIARIDPRPLQDKLNEARATVQRDEVALAKAQRDGERARALTGLIPRQQQEDVAFALRSAQAELASARAAAAAARTDLSYAVIRAPVSGVVASVNTQQGETVAAAFASPTFVTIVQPRDLELDALVDETDIGGVRPGDAVQFTVQTFPDRVLAARVVHVDPAAVIISGVVNYSVIARLAQVPAFLRPDMTANIIIRTGTRAALTLPDAALARDPRGNFVWLRRGAAAVRIRVTLGVRGTDWTEITSGITVRDRFGIAGKGHS